MKMNRYPAVAIVLGFLAVGVLQSEAVGNDLEKLQGEWAMVSHVANGELDEALAGAMRVVDGNEFVITRNDRVLRAARIKLDATKQPKWIDITFTQGPEKGKVRQGIYVLAGDTQQICYGELNGKRPTQFVSKAASGHRLVVFKRIETTVSGDGRADGEIVQYGAMHVAIGQGKHEGRVRLGDLTKRANFYAVAALAGLEGEVTIQDGTITATVVDENGCLKSATGSLEDKQATLLVGAYVHEWIEVTVDENVAPDGFDAYVAKTAKDVGISTDQPFIFTVDGNLTNVRVHVINGVCPIRARMKKIELSKEQQPYEKEMQQAAGTVVAVFAKDAVGKLTHPDTMTHGHILYRDTSSGSMVTGHLESVGLHKGAVLKFPKS